VIAFLWAWTDSHTHPARQGRRRRAHHGVPATLQAPCKPRSITIMPMFAARPFDLNTATAALAGVAVRAITTKTTTIIKG